MTLPITISITSDAARALVIAADLILPDLEYGQSRHGTTHPDVSQGRSALVDALAEFEAAKSVAGIQAKCQSERIELQLSPSARFTSEGWGRKVKAAGGEYGKALGHSSVRFVKVPLTDENTPLITELIREFPGGMRTCVVFRATETSEPAWACVGYIGRKEAAAKGLAGLVARRVSLLEQLATRRAAGESV